MRIILDGNGYEGVMLCRSFVSLPILLRLFLVFCTDIFLSVVKGQRSYSLPVVIDYNPKENYQQLREDVNELTAKVFPDGKISSIEQISIDVRVSPARAVFSDKATKLRRVNPLRITNEQVCNNLVNNSLAVILYNTESNQKEQERRGLTDYVTNYVSTISYALGFYQIPVISISSRNIEFSDKSTYPTFMRTLPLASEQADVWVALLKQFGYQKVILIYTEGADSDALVSRFRQDAKKWQIEIQTQLVLSGEGELSAGEARTALSSLQEYTSNIYLLHCTTAELARIVFDAAANLTRRGTAWIVTEPATNAADESGAMPIGILGMRLVQNETVSLEAALQTVKSGFTNFFEQNGSVEPPLGCTDDDNSEWLASDMGHVFYGQLTSTRVSVGRAGNYAYSSEGDRLFGRYSIINSRGKDGWVPVGYYQQSTGQRTPTLMNPFAHLYMSSEERIIWPGGTAVNPTEITLPKHLTVLTVEDDPFVYKIKPEGGDLNCSNYEELNSALEKKHPEISGFESGDEVTQETPTVGSASFKELYHNTRDGRQKRQALPQWHSCVLSLNNGSTESWCCTGYAINLLQRLATRNMTEFSFNLKLETVYGGRRLGPNGFRWTGMVAGLVNKSADMAIGALSINEERELVIDFSKPWLYHGITILEKKQPRISPMESFLQPFKPSLWASIFASVLCVGFALYLLDHKSPFGKFYDDEDTDGVQEVVPVGAATDSVFTHGTSLTVTERLQRIKRPPYSQQASVRSKLSSTGSVKKFDAGAMDENEPLSLSGAMWFVWGVLLDSGIGEKTPRSFSGRVLGVVWCGFSTIMVASYTANLAAFLVLDQPKRHLTGVTDSRLRNPSANFTFATVLDSNVHAHFKRSAELSTMYRKMEGGKQYSSSAAAIADVKNGQLNAFIWDSTRLEYAISKDCDLRTSGATFGRSSYAVGLQKNSPWTRIVTLAIVQLIEEGVMEALDAQWIGIRKCRPKQEDAPVRLGLTNMKDAFILVSVGIVVGCLLSMVEVKWRRSVLARERKELSANKCAKIWLSRASPRPDRAAHSGGTVKLQTIATDDAGRSCSSEPLLAKSPTPLSSTNDAVDQVPIVNLATATNRTNGGKRNSGTATALRPRTPSTDYGFARDDEHERQPLTQALRRQQQQRQYPQQQQQRPRSEALI